MAQFRAGTQEENAFLTALVSKALLIESGVPGVYGFGTVFTDLCERLEQLIGRHAADDAPQRLSFPPVLPKRVLEQSGYLNSFPHLGACIFGFQGTDADVPALVQAAADGASWPNQCQTDLVLTPAACYPVYPAIANCPALPAGGKCVDVGAAFVFRNEPSGDPARLQMFRQRELVRIGEPETVAAWRDKWRNRAMDLLGSLGLNPQVEVAADPFFGRTGRMMTISQREQQLKFEVTAQIASPAPTALASFNYHRNHFTSAYGIEMVGGGEAHSACLGFGMERCALALLRTHGFDPQSWPQHVRAVLW